MRVTPAVFVRTISVVSVIGISACSDEGVRLARTIAAIEAEVTGDAGTQLAPRYYLNQTGENARTLRSYANVLVSGGGYCSGFMVGPNILMTAAHCANTDTKTATFFAYRDQDPNQWATETYQCKFLVSGWCDMDWMYYYCDPVSGISPGDKYGYLDYNFHGTEMPTRPWAGDATYSYWWNPVTSFGLTYSGLLYSKGTIPDVHQNAWYEPNLAPFSGLYSNMYGYSGASGSAWLDTNNKLLAGPTSGAPDYTYAVTDRNHRTAASIYDVLFYGMVVHPNTSGCGSGNGMSTTNISSLGLTPSKYGNSSGVYLDNDYPYDYLPDITVDLERLRGENARDWYRLGFESARRNALWSKGASTVFQVYEPHNAVAYVNRTAAGSENVLTHDKLNLAAGNYTLSMRNLPANTTAGALEVYYEEWATTPTFPPMFYWAVKASQTAPTVAGNYNYSRLPFTATGAAGRIRIRLTGPRELYINNINVVRVGAINNFDTHDKRMLWKDENDARSAPRILSDGREVGVNWAGVVMGPSTSYSPLGTTELPFVAGTTARLCFDTQLASGTPPSGNWASVTLSTLTGSATLTNFTFQPTATWQSLCTPYVSVPNASVWTHFRTQATSASVSYRIDNVKVE